MKPEIEALKEWVKWKEAQPETTEDEKLFGEAISDVISQVGTWKAKFERAQEEIMVEEALKEIALKNLGYTEFELGRYTTLFEQSEAKREKLRSGILRFTKSLEPLSMCPTCVLENAKSYVQQLKQANALGDALAADASEDA